MPNARNVLFIVSDQHNAQFMGHKGHPDVKTPNLDRLAAEGVRFDNAVAQSPICTPARVSMLSGQYCHNHGYYGLRGANPGGLPTVLSHFRRAGYRAAAIGKIHCPEYWVEDDCDVFRECGESSIGGSPEYTAYLRERGVLADRDDQLLQEQKPGAQGIDGRPSRLPYDDCVDAWIAREATHFMGSSVESQRPFFAHVCLPRPHQIYTPSEPFWSMYDESKISLPPNADHDLRNRAPHLAQTVRQHRTGAWTLFEPRTFEAGRLRKLHAYLGCVSQVDHAVGQMLTCLRELGIDEDTLVVYTTDHGEYACQFGIMEKAPGICSDAVTRIPYIWRWGNRFPKGHVASQIVEQVDIAPTLCALAGLQQMQTADGRDISCLLRGNDREVHRIGVTECPWSKSVRKGKYRYVYYPPEMFAGEYPDGFGELYDLEQDPWETRNLYFGRDHAALITEMRAELLDWLVTTTRPKTLLPYVHADGHQSMTRFRNATNLDGKVHPDSIRSLFGRTEHWRCSYV